MLATPKVTQFVDAIIDLCVAEMPRSCGNCKKTFATFKDYVEGTTPIGAPQDYVKPGSNPIAVLSYENCSCGGTMVFTCKYESQQLQDWFLQTIEAQSAHEGRSAETILTELRTAVREKVLAGS